MKKDLAAFQGEWKIQWIEREGIKVDAETRLKEIGRPFSNWTIRGNQSKVGEIVVNTFKIDPGYEPKIIDFLPANEAKVEGIYKIDGDTMIWCWNTNVEAVPQRPLEFRAEKGSGLIVYSFARKK